MGKYPYFPKVNSTWNKQQTFDGITIKEVTTPSENPPANYMKLYFKADGKLYKLNSSGAETVSNSTVSAITQALLDAKANINNPSFTGVITIPNIANLETAVTANTAKVGITTAQANAITANTAKTGITSAQASEITANTAKISLDDNSVTLAKLAHGTADKYLGFDSSGVPEEKTVSAGGNNVIMQQDTTALNHTYSTTTTATAGETVNATVTAEGGFTDVPYMALGTSYTQRTLRTFATGRDITGILTLTAQAGGSGAYIHYDVWFTNTAGATIYTVSVQAVMSHGSQVKNFNFGALTDVKNIYWKGKNQYHPGYQGGMGIHTQSWTGTESAERDPVEMNSATNDGSGSSIYYASIETTNPFVTTDFGSSTRIASVAIMPRTQNTETIFQIQTSDDGSTWVTNRTILASSLTNWIYNYVKLTPVVARYVRIYGYSGASKVISFDEIKVKVGISDTSFLNGHYHKDISTTDTSLTLAGD